MIISVLITRGQAEGVMGNPFFSPKTTNGCEADQGIRWGLWKKCTMGRMGARPRAHSLCSGPASQRFLRGRAASASPRSLISEKPVQNREGHGLSSPATTQAQSTPSTGTLPSPREREVSEKENVPSETHL